MLDTLTRNIIYGSSYTAIEHIGTKKDAAIRVLQTSYKKNELNITEAHQIESIKSIGDIDPKIKHAILIINNEQLLEKKVPLSSTASDKGLLNQAFPNIDLGNFYYEIVRLENTAIVCICRKSYVESLIKDYEEIGVFITKWHLGITSISYLGPSIETSTTLSTEGYDCIYEEGRLKSVSPSEIDDNQTEAYYIQGLEISRKSVNALGAVVSSFQREETQVSSNALEAIAEKQTYFKQHRTFTLGLPIAIGALLVIFLINFLFYNHYFTKVENLESIGNTNVLQKQLLLTKDSIVAQKQKRFEDVIASSASASSYFIDRIAEKTPSTILLDQLTYHPLLKKAKPNKPILFKEKTIIINGSTPKNEDLSAWISELEGLDFIQEVSIKNLEKEGRSTDFSLTVLLEN